MIDWDKMTLEEHRKWREMERKAKAWDELKDIARNRRGNMDITRERMLAEIQAVINERRMTDLMTNAHIKRLHDDTAGVIREALAEVRRQEGQK